MAERIVYFLVIICFMGSCTHKADSIVLSKTVTIPIDESKLVLMRLPKKLRSINDSTVAAVNSSQKISLYDLRNGNNILNFSLDVFNFDSLVHETFQKKYNGIKTINYNQGYELNGTNYQLINYYNTDSAFYIQISLIAEVEDLKNPAEMKFSNRGDIKISQDSIENVRIVFMDYLNFIFITDQNFKIRQIVPMYIESTIRNNLYYPYYLKNFFVDNSFIYVPVAKIDPQPDLEAKINNEPANFCLAKIDLHNQQSVNYLMNHRTLDFTDFRLQDYLSTHFSYNVNDNRKLFCTAKEIAEIKESGTKLFHKKDLKSNEWIEDFHQNKNQELLMITYTIDKKGSVIISGKACPIDSVTGKHLKIFNLKTNTWSAEKALPVGHQDVALSRDKIIFLSRDEKNYYLNYIEYHED